MLESESPNIYTKNEEALANYTNSSSPAYTPGTMVSEGTWMVDYTFQPKFTSLLPSFDGTPAPRSGLSVFNKGIKLAACDSASLIHSQISSLNFTTFDAKWYIQTDTQGTMTILIDTTPQRGMEPIGDLWQGSRFIVLRELESRDDEERTDPSEGTVNLRFRCELMRDGKTEDGGNHVFGEDAWYRGA